MAPTPIELDPECSWGSNGGDDPNVQPFPLQQGTLLNVQLHKGCNLALAHLAPL